MTHSLVPVLDFGGQTAQLLVRRVRELGVYSELVPYDAPEEAVRKLNPRGLILSGGWASVYEPGAPKLPEWVQRADLPVLGVCYGMQLQSYALGGQVAPPAEREFGPATIEVLDDHSLFAGTPPEQLVWMSHGDRIEALPPGFHTLARSPNSPFAAMGDDARRWYGIQFHPEVMHTRYGRELLRNFIYTICGCRRRLARLQLRGRGDRAHPRPGWRRQGRLRALRRRQFGRGGAADPPRGRRPADLRVCG